MLAFDREQKLRFFSVLATVSAIISTGNRVIQAMSGQPGEDKAAKTMTDAIKVLRETLLPGDSFAEEKKMQKVLSTLEKEVAKGPIRIRPQSTGRKKKRGIARKRQE